MLHKISKLGTFLHRNMLPMLHVWQQALPGACALALPDQPGGGGRPGPAAVGRRGRLHHGPPAAEEGDLAGRESMRVRVRDLTLLQSVGAGGSTVDPLLRKEAA